MPIYLVKNASNMSNYTILWVKKDNKIQFFRFLTKKLLLSCPYFVKKRPFSQKHTALMPIFCQTNVHSLKNTVLSSHFFSFFIKNPLFPCPYLDQKNVNSVKTILHGPWAKKVNRMLFFLIVHEKINALMPIFCQYNPQRPKIDHQATRGIKSSSRGPDLTRI